ncbi:MAG: methyltransferase domain-containing protein [Myxococcota bacterium]|nr:methyltransferase domain-containing protein [Myxococcota bacterium]
MTASIPSSCGTDPEPQARREALAQRLVESAVATLELYGVHLGVRLGLYPLLAEHPRTPSELAEAAGIAPRYAREWLEQQAVAGLLEVDDPTRPAGARRYRLPAATAPVLTEPEDPDHVAPLATMMVGVASALDRVEEAYRRGGGVSFAEFGPHMRHGQGGINRPAVARDLPAVWIPAMPDLHHRLRTTATRIADVGCGVGWSTLALARAFPRADVVGVEPDAASIVEARTHAARAGVAPRFVEGDAARLPQLGRFDLVVVVEALHDMRAPSAALAALRRALAPDGSILVVDERVAERFQAPGDLIERLMYGWSVSHCLPAALADAPPAPDLPDAEDALEPTGTALRPDTVRRLAARAGLERMEELDVPHELFRLYRLRPGAAEGAS